MWDREIGYERDFKAGGAGEIVLFLPFRLVKAEAILASSVKAEEMMGMDRELILATSVAVAIQDMARDMAAAEEEVVVHMQVAHHWLDLWQEDNYQVEWVCRVDPDPDPEGRGERQTLSPAQRRNLNPHANSWAQITCLIHLIILFLRHPSSAGRK